MKKTVLFLILATFFVACQQNKQYTINGTVADANFNGKNVYVQDTAMTTIDTAVIENGAFSFKGEADSTVLRFILLDESVQATAANRIPVLIEPGNTIEVKFDSVITVTGSPVNDAYTDLRNQQQELNKKARSIINEYNSAEAAGKMTDSLDAEITNAFEKVRSEMDSVNFSFLKNNIKNDLGKFIFASQWQMFKPEQQKELLGMTDDAFKAQPAIQRMTKRIENYENVAIGKPFVDFTMKDPKGNDVSLSDYAGKGKYVLVDFWASWCGPCRDEMPNVVKAYNQYKNKGFEIVGVSLDRDHDKWLQGIKDLNITWPQMSDVMFWESPVVDLYAIEGIPHTVLLDKEGKIIAKDLRGAELDAKLAKLMN